MRAVAATKAGRVFFRPTAHRLDWLVSKLTGGKRTLPGSRRPAVGHPHRHLRQAANYGDAKHPAWYHNLKVNPAATVVKCQWVSVT
jgi:hypothetical protein